MNREPDPAKQRVFMRKYEKEALDTSAHQFITLWWFKINPHRSMVKGWKIAPSHYLNQSLDQVWLDKEPLYRRRYLPRPPLIRRRARGGRRRR